MICQMRRHVPRTDIPRYVSDIVAVVRSTRRRSVSKQVQFDEFDRLDMVRVPGAFSEAEAKAMRAAVWDTLQRRCGVSPDDRATWDAPISGTLQKLRTRELFKPTFGPAVQSTLDDLMGPGRWERPNHWGSFLVSFPQPPGARSRPNFHTDFAYDLAPDRIDGALVFAFLGSVPEGGGGTLVVEGSHRVIAGFIDAKPHLKRARMKVTRKALLASHPFLKSLSGGWTDSDWVADLPRSHETVLGNEVRVVELTGQPGDVVICHPWMLHSPTPNRGTEPRFMSVQRISRRRS